MSKLSKKALFVKRSEAAKKGWDTRREQRNTDKPKSGKAKKSSAGSASKRSIRSDRAATEIAKIRAKAERYKSETDRKLREANRKLRLAIEGKREADKAKRKAQRERTEIRKANEKALKSLKTSETMIANMARNGVPIRNILKQIPESGHEHAKKIVIQTRLDMAADLYHDVRWEAFDLADELDWDISDVFDAWQYDEAG